MLADFKSKYDECDYCGQRELIYGYRMFEGDSHMKIETECVGCGKIFIKIVSNDDYETIRLKETNDT